jgi:hypothetical protein
VLSRRLTNSIIESTSLEKVDTKQILRLQSSASKKGLHLISCVAKIFLKKNMTMRMSSSASFRFVPISKWGCRARHRRAQSILLLLCISACSSFLLERIPSATIKSTSLCMSSPSPANIPGTSSRTWSQKPRQQGHSIVSGNTNSKAALLVTPTPEMKTAKRVRQKTKPMPVTGYNAKAIEDYYDRRPFQVGWRLNSLGFPLLGTLRTTMEANRHFNI